MNIGKYIKKKELKIFLILIILLKLNNFYIKNDSLKINKLKLNNDKNINRYNYRHLSKIKGINYLKRCLNSLNKNETTSNFNILNFIFFNFKNKILKQNPKITVIIPIYNCQNSIELSLSSVLNQNMKDFEVILINDNSKDNSLNIINKMKNNDGRIKIINNLKNMGTLYSRCIGVLNAKGKYIFSLDNDDLFLDDDIFGTVYALADHDKYDIVEFRAFTILNYHPKIKDLKENAANYKPNNLILHQPELGIFPISRKKKFYPNDFIIWGKCFETKLYQMSVNTLGEKRYSIYNCWTEDISMLFIIFNLANSYIFIHKYGIFHLISNTTASNTLLNDHKIFAEIFLLDIILDFLKEIEKYKKYVVQKAFDVFIKIKNYQLNKESKKYLNLILQKLFDCKYINKKDKIIIKKKFIKYIT